MQTKVSEVKTDEDLDKVWEELEATAKAFFDSLEKMRSQIEELEEVVEKYKMSFTGITMNIAEAILKKEKENES